MLLSSHDGIWTADPFRSTSVLKLPASQSGNEAIHNQAVAHGIPTYPLLYNPNPQNKGQLTLNEALFGPCFGMGGIERGILAAYEAQQAQVESADALKGQLGNLCGV